MRLQKLIYQAIIWRGLYYASVFALNIIIARMFKAHGSGLVNYFITNLSFLLLITSLSLESALGYFASRKDISISKLTGIGLVLAIVSALLSSALFMLFFGQQAGAWFDSPYIISFIYVLGVVLTNYFGSLYYAHNRPVLPNIILLVINVLVAVSIADAYVNHYDPEVEDLMLQVYMASFLVQGLLIFIAWSAGQGRAFLNIQLPARHEMKQLLNYAFAALMANVIFFLVYRVDYWFVESFCTPEALGNYIQVSKLGQIFLLLPSIIATAVFTRTAGGNQDHIRSVIEIISRWLLFFYIVFVAVILVTGKWLFPLVYGHSFDQMYAPFVLLTPGILSLSTLSLLTAFYAGRNKMGINIRGSMIAFIVIVAGDFLLIPRYGIMAAALVSSIGYICFQVYVLREFRKEYRSDLMAFFIPKWSDWDKVKQYIRAEAN
ncbi:MAG TPA: polysaccharide biosynthesis C-terminal domain-containing protein [Chitinophagaceae bacterium]|nr:polysaccharide biosynthesis C-terminal domain-containing protein [Chitinophagaceae bacterium]